MKILFFFLAQFLSSLAFATDCPTAQSACSSYYANSPGYVCSEEDGNAGHGIYYYATSGYDLQHYLYSSCTAVSAIPTCTQLGDFKAHLTTAPSSSAYQALAAGTCLASGCNAHASSMAVNSDGSADVIMTVSSLTSCLPASGATSGTSATATSTTDKYGNPKPSGGTCPTGFGYAAVSGQNGSAAYCLPSGSTLLTSGQTQKMIKNPDGTLSVDPNSPPSTTNTKFTVNPDSSVSSSVTQSGQYGGSSSSGENSATPSTPDVCATNPNSVMCADASAPEPSDLIDQTIASTSSITVTPDTVLPSGVGTCPLTDKTVSVLTASVTLPFSQACQFLDLVRPVVLFVSYLMAGLILLRRT